MQKIKITKFKKESSKNHPLKARDGALFLAREFIQNSRRFLEIVIKGCGNTPTKVVFINKSHIGYKVIDLDFEIISPELEDLKKENNILNNDNRNFSEDIQVLNNVISNLKDDLTQAKDSRDEYRDWMNDLREDLDKKNEEYNFLWDSRIEISEASKKKDAIIAEKAKSLENQKQIIKLLSQEL